MKSRCIMEPYFGILVRVGEASLGWGWLVLEEGCNLGPYAEIKCNYPSTYFRSKDPQ